MTSNFFADRFVCNPQETPFRRGVGPAAEPELGDTAGTAPSGGWASAPEDRSGMGCCYQYILLPSVYIITINIYYYHQYILLPSVYIITILYHALVYYTKCYYITVNIAIDNGDDDNDANAARCFSRAAPRQSSPEVPGPGGCRGEGRVPGPLCHPSSPLPNGRETRSSPSMPQRWNKDD